MHGIYFIGVVFIISLLVASLVHRPVLLFAKKHNFYDNPNARKLQRRPIPVMGGFVVFVGALVGSLCYWFKRDCSSLIPVQVAMFLMLLVGAWDDAKNLSPRIKFIFEIAIVIALALVNHSPINSLHGLWGVNEFSPWIAWPLTVFACVGIINAINMIDGVDGLSSGMCITIFGFLGLLFFKSWDFVHAALAVAIVGGLIPFFITNVFGERSKMFIGDAGTLMLGIVISEMVMSILTSESVCTYRISNSFCLIAFTLAVVAIPVFDTLRVMFGRISRGESPFYPDKTHLHHAFIDYGFHHLETSLMEILLNTTIVSIWYGLYKSHLPMEFQLYGVIVAGIAVCFGLYWMLGRRKRFANKVKEKYKLSLEEYNSLSDEERKKLDEKQE